MERMFSVEEENPIPNHVGNPPQQLLLQPQVVSGGVRGVGINLGGGIGGGEAANRSPPEWFFRKSTEESLLLDVPAPLAVDPDANLDLYNSSVAEMSHKRHYKFHQEEKDNMVDLIGMPFAPSMASAVLDPMAYNTMLRQKLDADLAVVAMWRSSRGIRRQSSHGNRASQNSNVSNNLGSPNHIGDVGVHQLSSSSLEPSQSDDDMEGDVETMGNRNVTAAKMKKRKESNRDSARRSRSRKAAHMKELEEQVSLLRVENNSLTRRLAELSQKYTNVTVDNRVLKANVETLETKVKMSEETMKRLTCASKLPQAISNISSLRIPLSGSRLDNITSIPVPTHDTPVSYFATTTTDDNINNSYIPELARTSSLQIHNRSTSLHMHHEMSLDHHQIRLCGNMPSASVPASEWEATMLEQSDFANIDM